MRWTVVHPGPFWSVADVYNGWAEALAATGQQIHVFNLGDRLVFYDSAYLELEDGRYEKALPSHDDVVGLAVNGLAAHLWKIRPQILFVVSGFFTDPDLLDHARSLGIRVILLHTECPYEDDRGMDLAAHVDLNLVNDPISVARFSTVAPTVYCPHGYRPAVHHPGPVMPEKVCDLGWVGTGSRTRMLFFELLARHIPSLDVIFGGTWLGLPETSPVYPWLAHEPGRCVDNTEVADLYRSMRCGINVYRREANDGRFLEGHGVGPREIEMAACGAFFLRDPRPEGDALFPMLPTFSGPEEAAGLLHWWLAHDDLRAAAGLKAREAVENRTFAHHAAELLRILKIDE